MPKLNADPASATEIPKKNPLDRLQQQGVNINEAPALLRDLTKILESEPLIDLATTNLKSLHIQPKHTVSNATGTDIAAC